MASSKTTIYKNTSKMAIYLFTCSIHQETMHRYWSEKPKYQDEKSLQNKLLQSIVYSDLVNIPETTKDIQSKTSPWVMSRENETSHTVSPTF